MTNMLISEYDHRLIQEMAEEVNSLRAENKVLREKNEAQILSYLKSTGLVAGLLINFKEKLVKDGIKRFVQSKHG